MAQVKQNKAVKMMTTHHDQLMRSAQSVDVTSLNDPSTIQAAREERRPRPLPSVLESIEAQRSSADYVKQCPTCFAWYNDGERHVCEQTAPQLPEHIECDIKEFYEENGRRSLNADLSQLDVDELFEAYLQWNGIVGYTRDIIEALDAIRAFKGEVR